MTRHVVSLELAKRLKEAGFPQDCAFAWSNSEDGPIAFYGWPFEQHNAICAAPLLSEVMEQVGDCDVQRDSRDGGYWVAFDDRPLRNPHTQSADTGPDAAALLWLALKEAGK